MCERYAWEVSIQLTQSLVRECIPLQERTHSVSLCTYSCTACVSTCSLGPSHNTCTSRQTSSASAKHSWRYCQIYAHIAHKISSTVWWSSHDPIRTHTFCHDHQFGSWMACSVSPLLHSVQRQASRPVTHVARHHSVFARSTHSSSSASIHWRNPHEHDPSPVTTTDPTIQMHNASFTRCTVQDEPLIYACALDTFLKAELAGRLPTWNEYSRSRLIRTRLVRRPA